MSGRTTIPCPDCGWNDNSITGWIIRNLGETEYGFQREELIGQVVHCDKCENVWDDLNE